MESTEKRIKVLFFIPNLMAGGAERVMTFLSKNLDKSHFDSTLIVIGSKEEIAYDISDMKIEFLNEPRVLYSIPSIIRCIKINKADVVIGTVSHLNLALGFVSYLFPKTKFIGRQAAITKVSFNQETIKKNNRFSILLKIALKKLDYVICQSSDMLEDCRLEFNLNRERLKIISNPITDDFSVKKTSYSSNETQINFITVGRLVTIKGHSRILEILGSLKKPFVYTIIGDGPLKLEINELIKKLGLESRVKFIDFTKEISKYLKASDFYLQGSLSEGFPNALLESCAVGTPAIAFDVPGGTKEIIEDGINGFLVQSEEEFLERLNNLPNLDPKIVSESVYKKFDKAIILKKYESFFMEIVKKK